MPTTQEIKTEMTRLYEIEEKYNRILVFLGSRYIVDLGFGEMVRESNEEFRTVEWMEVEDEMRNVDYRRIVRGN